MKEIEDIGRMKVRNDDAFLSLIVLFGDSESLQCVCVWASTFMTNSQRCNMNKNRVIGTMKFYGELTRACTSQQWQRHSPLHLSSFHATEQLHFLHHHLHLAVSHECSFLSQCAVLSSQERLEKLRHCMHRAWRDTKELDLLGHVRATKRYKYGEEWYAARTRMISTRRPSEAPEQMEE